MYVTLKRYYSLFDNFIYKKLCQFLVDFFSVFSVTRLLNSYMKIMIKNRILIFIQLPVFAGLLFSQTEIRKVTDFVNPFIGTTNGGNTFPGAVRPWGMVSVSPHTAPAAPSGYYANEKYCYGFGMVHLSGTGCADLGSVIVSVTRGEPLPDPEDYKSTFSNEAAAPGFFSVVLIEPAVEIEMTVSNRCGILKIMPQVEGDLNVQIDASRNLSLVGGGAVNILSQRIIEGYNIAGGFCGEANRQCVFFSAELSEFALDNGVWFDDQISNEKYAQAKEQSLGAWICINGNKNQPLFIKIGISYVSAKNARENLAAEIPNWDFDDIRKQAAAAWETELSKIQINGGSKTDLIKFYTALYHALIHPNIISDVNGDYPLMGHRGIGKYSNRDRYSIFSLWDTYRTLHPLLTLLYPQRQSAIIQSMLDMYEESGFLPKWELISNETYMMVGDASAIVIADSYFKGIRDFDVLKAYAAMKKPATILPGEAAPPVRAGYHQLLVFEYIPFEQDTTEDWWVWGPVSTTQEYCLADWAIARLAGALGKKDDEWEFDKRSLYYRNLFDIERQFIRPKLRSGKWVTPFDPLQTEGSGSWRGSGGPGYVEGNAYNYTWFAPHDIDGLISLFGGKEAFIGKLVQCFEDGQFTINNEPDIAYPYLFTYFPDAAYRTHRLTQEIMKQDFGEGADGLPGNDDAGTISAWFVFSALGFYPACPASPEYRIGSPLFEKAVLQLDDRYYSGKQFIIDTRGRSSGNAKLIQVLLNGEPVENFQLLHERVMVEGNLLFEYK